MHELDWLAERYQADRARLRAVAYRMLGSLSEADDAVQEAWLKVSRSDTSKVENLDGWLTTIVARVCLDMLRSRQSRREEPLDPGVSEPTAGSSAGIDPEHEALVADSVGPALLVVLESLAPLERLAFVLHDLFAVPHDQIAPIIGRSPAAARQLASRARRRVHGTAMVPDTELTCQREVVEAFLAAARHGDFDALLAVLDPDVVVRADGAAVPSGVALEVRGAAAVAKRAQAGATAEAQPALVNGAVGAVMAPRGRLRLVLAFTITGGRIVELNVVADPEHLRRLDLALLDDGRTDLGPDAHRQRSQSPP